MRSNKVSGFWSLMGEGGREGHQLEQRERQGEGYGSSLCPRPRFATAVDMPAHISLWGSGESSGRGPDTSFLITDRCLQSGSQEMGSGEICPQEVLSSWKQLE